MPPAFIRICDASVLRRAKGGQPQGAPLQCQRKTFHARHCTGLDCRKALDLNISASMTDVPLDVRVALMRRYGSASQSYSATYQAGLEHFGDERGFLAYKKVWGTSLVLSDPIAPAQNIRDLISRFLKDHPDAGFWYLSRRVAETLASLGFSVNPMGPETRIDLASYDFRGRHKQSFRRATSRMIRNGCVTRESTLADVGLEQVRAVSDQWRRTRTIRNHEVAFLNRPLVLDEEPDVRRFFSFDGAGKLAAFAFFDPVYADSEVVGYMHQHSRHLPEADAMVHFAIMQLAIETFQKEGRKLLYLGLSPCAQIKNDDFRVQRTYLVWRSFRVAYKSRLFNRYIYPLKGHEEHKRRFHGVPEQTYYAFNTFPSLPRVLKLLWASKLI
jgi:lysylphosphatidylglycerol synthetase-like protein (DUF2156 family)